MKPVAVIYAFKPQGSLTMDTGTGKTQITLLGGAIASVIIWAINTYALKTPMPDYIDSSIITIICSLCAYFTPHDASVANLIPGKGPSQ